MMQPKGLLVCVASMVLISVNVATLRTEDEVMLNCSKCKCCKGSCDPSTGVCDSQGCIDGYWGKSNNDGHCRNLCWRTKPCVSCGIGGGKWCTMCVDGFYVPSVTRGEAPHCTFKCFPGCQACVSTANNCSSCKPGYSGSGCETCPNNCADCPSCTASNPGFYGPPQCVEMCPANCDRCDDALSCKDCKAGFYGTLCQHVCPPGCTLSGCNKHSRDCLSCRHRLDGKRCDVCVAGRYGNDCHLHCSVYCKDKQCDRRSGTCKNGCTYQHMEGLMCEKCETGWHGTTCYYRCSAGCKNLTCGKVDGACVNGCSENFTGQKCRECISGKYGDSCDRNCPANCLNGMCYKRNGRCKGCSGNFDGYTCNTCKNGFYGEQCNNQCSSGCHFGKCDRKNGSCSPCSHGYYGLKCNKTCSHGCHYSICVQETGVCHHRCKANYSGDKCCTHAVNGNCRNCSTSNSCSVCQNGFFGKHCNKTCPELCLDGTCDFSMGHCLNCDRLRYGDECELSCQSSCLEGQPGTRICDIKTGVCLNGCKSGTYGVTKCENKCPATCLTPEHTDLHTEICTRDTGDCSIGCEDGFHGSQCSERCSNNCLGNTCNSTNGYCDCKEGFKGSTCVEAIPQTVTKSIVGGIGGAVVVIIVIVVVVVLIVFRRRKLSTTPDTNQRKSCTKTKETGASGSLYENFESTSTDIHNMGFIDCSKENEAFTRERDGTDHTEDRDPDSIDVNVYTNDEQDDVYVNQQPQAIKVAQLNAYVKSKTSNIFKKEFLDIPNKLSAPYTVSQLPQNIGKNRYKGIYPYDHSRVTIDSEPDFFINASFINGFRQDKQYIASLGPTLANSGKYEVFWKMVWHQNVDVIVMLTNLVEGVVQKCEQYWPSVNSAHSYGDITVTCHQETEFAEYVIRRVSLIKDGRKKCISFFHFTVWPDKSVPDDVCSLVDFREKINNIRNANSGPMLVHCSAGVGRTGTFIALDILIKTAESLGTVNVPKCVETLREQRVNMIQTASQYEYLYKCLVYKLGTECNLMTPQEISDVITKANRRTFARLYKDWNAIDFDRDDDDEDARQRNSSLTDKNRPGADVPGNRWRPRLFLNRALEDTDYINAVQINACSREDGFIIAQTPLPDTVADFLTMIIQMRATYVVSLDDLHKRKQDEGVYQPPDNQKMTHGAFTISSEKCAPNQYYVERRLKLTSAVKSMGSMEFQHFEFTQWPRDDALPSDTEGFLQLVKIINRKMETTDSPVIVHCLKGSRRSAIFCAVSVLLEKLRLEQRASVLNTLRQIKLRRRTAFSKKEDVEFCYRCVAATEDNKDIYYNL